MRLAEVTHQGSRQSTSEKVREVFEKAIKLKRDAIAANAIVAADQAIARHYNLPNADFLPRAIHGGQYINDKGTYFGGFAPTWARRTFETIATRHFTAATDLCLIDYHTGLGPLGHGPCGRRRN